MTRQGWIGKRPDNRPLRRTPTPEERREKAMRAEIRRLKELGLIGNRVPPNWNWKLGEDNGIVAAFTKGEAKARVKEALGLPKKKKLPKELELTRVEVE